MLNKLKTLSLLSFLMAFVLLSCQKEDQSVKTPVDQKSMTDLWPQASNPNNPEEGNQVGVYHNHGLVYFAEQRAGYGSDDAWFREVYTHNLDFLCNPNDPTYCPNLTDAELNDLVNSVRGDFNNVIANEPVEVQQYINDMLGIFDAHTFDSYDAFKSEMVNLETHIEEDRSISSSDKQMLLISAQVARYSGFYWSDQIKNGMSDWDDTDADVAAAIDWGDVAKADVKGAVGGFIGGLFSGNPLGGAAAGALSASAVELIDQVW